jgi:hypothetical protein
MRRRTEGARRSCPPRGGPPPSTRTPTGNRSLATRSALASACPTRLPPNRCASSAWARASAPGPVAAEGRRAAARQAPRRRGNLPVRALRPRAVGLRPAPRSAGSRRGRLLPARRAAAWVPRGSKDGQRIWQTVYPGSRTCHPSMSPANLPANTYSCRQRSAVAAVNAQDVAVINLRVDSQTV